ncbi:hypothetical protein [Pimelobacter simplex]|uniref:hypothetical protein n=1 Tax=Nocardioides simplex TaxID=2045 RepID=UPI00215068CB|nr:hypothetical protein [Pimelobacter simplex]UUW90573.1 hypothetical protein M0M43_03525 [Pimelobacter simplex]UUW94404.1 hypothetical protein M0M48_22045 [Pimelobacter simplex]
MQGSSLGPVVRRTTEFDALVQHRLWRLQREIAAAQAALAPDAEIEILTHLRGVLAGLSTTLSDPR